MRKYHVFKNYQISIYNSPFFFEYAQRYYCISDFARFLRQEENIDFIIYDKGLTFTVLKLKKRYIYIYLDIRYNMR